MSTLVVAVALLMSWVAATPAGDLGALCDASTPCAEGLTCRDGFCLRLSNEAPAAPVPTPKPAVEPKPESAPEPAPEPVAPDPPPVSPAPFVVEPLTEMEQGDAEQPKVSPTEGASPRDAGSDTTAPAAPSAADSPPVSAGAPVDEAVPAPLAPLSAEASRERATLADDATGQVWGAAGARAIASPALFCGGCLLGAGACTTLGGLSFLEASDRGAFTEFPESNDNARLGGNIGLAVGILASLASAPLLLVGEGAALYGSFLDVSLCGSSLGLDDTVLTALAGGHGVAWTLAPQLLGCGAALCGGGAWVWVAANGVNAYPDTDASARTILNGYESTATAMMLASTIPLGLALVTGLTGIGLDFATVVRANGLGAESRESIGSSASRESPLAAVTSSKASMEVAY